MKDYAKDAVELLRAESEIARKVLKDWEVKTNTEVVDLYSTLSNRDKRFWQFEVLKHARARPRSRIDYNKKLLEFEILLSPNYAENPDIPIEVLSLHEFLHELLDLMRPKGFRYVKNPKSFPSQRFKEYKTSRLSYELVFIQRFDVYPFNRPTPYHVAGICAGEEVSGREILRRLHEVGEIETAINFDFFIPDEESFVNHLVFTIFKDEKKNSLKTYTNEAIKIMKDISFLKEIKYGIKEVNKDYLSCERLSEDAKALDGLYIRFMKDICYIYGIFSSELSRNIDDELERYARRERDYFVEERLKPKYQQLKNYTKNFLWKVI